MADQFDTLFEDYAVPALQEHLGQDVTHYPRGDETAGVTIEDALFTEMPAAADTEFGWDNIRRATIEVANTTTLDPTDKWDVAGLRWFTNTIGPDIGGLITVHVENRNEALRRPPKS